MRLQRYPGMTASYERGRLFGSCSVAILTFAEVSTAASGDPSNFVTNHED
jgi:hypothetical protein